MLGKDVILKIKTVVISLVVLLISVTLIQCTKNDKTTDPLANTDKWKFVIMGDTRGDFDPAKKPPYNLSTATGVSPFLPQIAAKIASMNPEFVLHVGDLIMGDSYKDAVEMGYFPGVVAIPYVNQFQAFKNATLPITAANIPIYTVRGNHEVSAEYGISGTIDSTLAAAYYDAFGQYLPKNNFAQQGLTYSFIHKQVTVVAVDQYSSFVPPNPLPIPWYHPANSDWGSNFYGYHTIDQTWISSQLHNSNTSFKIVLAHEPIFIASGVPAGGYKWSPELFFGPAQFNGETNRQQFVDMMGNNGVQLYAVGHVHNLSVGSFTDASGHKMYQLISGNGGALPLDANPVPPTPESALRDVQYEMNRMGFTLVTVDPAANTMLLEYYVMEPNSTSWSKESFSTLVNGAPK